MKLSKAQREVLQLLSERQDRRITFYSAKRGIVVYNQNTVPVKVRARTFNSLILNGTIKIDSSIPGMTLYKITDAGRTALLTPSTEQGED